ncbi:hypothetical protein B0H19DRAFT_461962 [Mycena capillaripes]|nr:hypothetical protein B0H19DRAFT_461962 [Mycena capillaripes]
MYPQLRLVYTHCFRLLFRHLCTTTGYVPSHLISHLIHFLSISLLLHYPLIPNPPSTLHGALTAPFHLRGLSVAVLAHALPPCLLASLHALSIPLHHPRRMKKKLVPFGLVLSFFFYLHSSRPRIGSPAEPVPPKKES